MMAAPNPDPGRITAAMWRLWTEFDAHRPKTALGGIYAHKSGYHSSRNENRATWPGDYSVDDFAADRKGPSDKAAALDLTFTEAQSGNYTEIIRYAKRLDTAARARDPRLYLPDGTPVLREFIATLDGDRVYAYDLQRRRSDHNRDDSHMWHIHLSVTRQFVADWDVLAGVLSVLIGESIVALTKDDIKTIMQWDPNDTSGISNWSWRGDFKTNSTVQARFAWWLGPEEAHNARVEAAAARADVAAMRREQAAAHAAILARLGGQDVTTVVRRELETAATRERAERAAEREQLAAELAPGLAEALHNAVGEGLGADAARQIVEDAMREVFGGLDDDAEQTRG